MDCCKCCKPIPEARLKALPDTKTCVECSSVERDYVRTIISGKTTYSEVEVIKNKDTKEYLQKLDSKGRQGFGSMLYRASKSIPEPKASSVKLNTRVARTMPEFTRANFEKVLEEAMLFFEYLNEQHPNIKFTFELEQNGKLPFLDVLVDKKEGDGFYTSVYHKKTYTGLLTNFLSYIPLAYKLSLVKTLIHRIYCICNTWEIITKHIKELKEVLGRNLYPQNVIDNEIRKYINSRSHAGD